LSDVSEEYACLASPVESKRYVFPVHTMKTYKGSNCAGVLSFLTLVLDGGELSD